MYCFIYEKLFFCETDFDFFMEILLCRHDVLFCQLTLQMSK